jgi:dTMP kinase
MTRMLIAIEGPKAVGKTTICGALGRRLAGDNLRNHVVLTKEPTAGFNLAQETRISGFDLARAIADDRAIHLREVITPALGSGKVVICDRYILSSLVFHGADGVPAERIWRLNQDFPLPDLNLLVTADADVLLARRAAREAPTRLEAARHPADELADYARYAEAMQIRGVKRISVDNTRDGDLANAVNSIVEIVAKATQS